MLQFRYEKDFMLTTPADLYTLHPLPPPHMRGRDEWSDGESEPDRGTVELEQCRGEDLFGFKVPLKFQGAVGAREGNFIL